MTVKDRSPVPSEQSFSKADFAEVCDFEELTAEQMRALRPFRDAFPDMAASIRRVRGPSKEPTKQQISLRLDRDVIERFKAQGPGWQTRMGEALRKAVGL